MRALQDSQRAPTRMGLALALANAVAEGKPRPEAGDALGLRVLQGNQDLVAQRVAREAGAGPHAQPIAPAVAGAQFLHRALRELAIAPSPLGALLLGRARP